MKLDMGKSCVRFREVTELPLLEIGKLMAAIPPDKYIEMYRASRNEKQSRGSRFGLRTA